MTKEYHYQVKVVWTGNRGEGTKNYRAYDREHKILSEGKQDLLCSSDAAFKGDSTKWNPEELLLASLSSCHMLWYLHLCADHGIAVISYEDRPTAIMKVESSGTGFFEEATLHPFITVSNLDQVGLAQSLHALAHEKCFIANSVRFPTKIDFSIQVVSPSS